MATQEPELRYCRCKHLEISHDKLGCTWCRCRCYKYDRIHSINAQNRAVEQTLSNRDLNLVFSEEAPTR